MRSFDVFQLPDDSYVAVKHGFSWPAFFFNWIWCLVIARLWGWALVCAGVIAVSNGISETTDEPAALIIVLLADIGFLVWFSFNANEFRRRKYLRLGYALIREKVDADNPKGSISIAQDENQSGKGEKTINAPLRTETPQTIVSPSLVSQPGPVPENRPAVKAGQEAIGEPMTTGTTRDKESEFLPKPLRK